ncbi:hypothetical protein RVR_10180 [Actinacidiphila reveromycinica]|uniref:Carrier domain-containing protein n=1 Tax=Actinacidiphila reveromycinica TaxID=659352 RepID=A0A7U3UXX2_9ACTN|nr:phosphopantetheine-binding protein [Streptomyces sp. SN-593]BBB02301.1 hypothetical protein RVR_10180 [Streptomyces sp. SN-593]
MTPPDPSSPPTTAGGTPPAAPRTSPVVDPAPAPGPGPGSAPAAAAEHRADLDLDLDLLRAAVADVLGIAPEKVGDDDNLVALGVESVRVMAISAQLRKYRVRIGYAQMIEEPTLRAWWRLVADSAPGGAATDAGRAG